MKRLLFVFALAAIACPAAPTSAQSPSPAAVSAPQDRGAYGLTSEERSTLIAADGVARNDPAVVTALAAMQAAKAVACATMIVKTPSIAPLLEKIEPSNAPAPGATPVQLTDAEKAQLKAARDSIKGTPEADAWKQATDDFRAALRKATIAANPACEAILDKLPQGAGMGRPKPAASTTASPPQ